MSGSFEKPDIGSQHEEKESLKKKALLRWGTPGHDFEWVLNLEGYDINNYIPDMHGGPDDICNRLEGILGEGFRADNRGSRIEIFTPDDTPRYQEVVYAIGKVFEEEWEGDEWDIEVQDREQVENRHRSVEESTKKGLEEARERIQEKLRQIREERGEDNK